MYIENNTYKSRSYRTKHFFIDTDADDDILLVSYINSFEKYQSWLPAACFLYPKFIISVQYIYIDVCSYTDINECYTIDRPAI